MRRRAVDVLLAAICACIIVVLASGLVMSSWAAAGGAHGAGIARAIHLPLVHMGFCLIALHAGMQMHRAIPVLRKGLPSGGMLRVCAVLLCVALVAFALWSLIDLRFIDYITGTVGFAFMETTKPVLLDLVECIAIFLAFALLGHVISRAAKNARPCP